MILFLKIIVKNFVGFKIAKKIAKFVVKIIFCMCFFFVFVFLSIIQFSVVLTYEMTPDTVKTQESSGCVTEQSLINTL